MFYNCSELINLNLSNFDTSSCVSFHSMFYGCNKLVSLDISNFDASKSFYLIDMFYNCSNLQYINFQNFIEYENSNFTNIFYDVPDNIVYCSNHEENMPNIIEKLKTKSCVFNDCSNNWKLKIKKIIDDKNICVDDCKEDNEYSYEYENKCYNYCPEGTHLLYYIDYLCIINCPENIPYEKDNECIDYCSGNDFFNKLCRISNDTIQSKEYMINTITNEIINNYMNSSIFSILSELKEGNSDLIIKDKKEIYQITNSIKLKNHEYNNISSIDFGECENILRKIYNINDNQKLIIFKMEYKIDSFSIPIIEYQIFHPITNELLNLKYCKNLKINISIPVTIEERYLYKHNPYSEYYNDECFPNITECQTINRTYLLNKRKEEFNNKYLSLCEVNCKYNEYYIYTKKVSCECDIKTNFTVLSDLLKKKNKLLYNIRIDLNETKECSIEDFFNYKCILNDTIEDYQTIENIYEVCFAFKVKAQNYSYYSYTRFYDENDLKEFVENCQRLSFYNTDTKFDYGNQFITLSTCEYSQNNGRMIVIGVKR